MKTLFAMTVVMTLAFVQLGHAQAKIESMKFGTAIENNDVTGEATTFPASGGKVYCWMRITGAQETTVTMKWSFNGTVMDEIPLEIKTWSMRTYSHKEIYRAGAWKVEIVDAAGTVLQAGEFTAQ